MADTKFNDGGAAFPSAIDDAHLEYRERGMSLRDYFAGQALLGILAHPETIAASAVDFGQEAPQHAANIAYQIADAMLVARSAT